MILRLIMLLWWHRVEFKKREVAWGVQAGVREEGKGPAFV